MNSERPSWVAPKYGVELRASTPARSRRTSGMPARTRAETTAGPRGRLLGAPKTSSTRDPPSTPAPTASTMSSGPSCAAAARKNTATMTTSQPRRRHGRLIQGDPSTTVETMPAMKLESITPIDATSRSHSGRCTAISSSGVPKVSTMMLFRKDAVDCATKAARISIPKSRNRRRQSTTSPTAAGISEATPWNKQVQRPRQRLRQGVEGADRVPLEPDQRVRRAGRDQQAEEHEEHTDDEVEHVRRRAHVALGRRLVDLGLDRRRPGSRRLPPRPVAVRGDGDDAHDEGAGRDHQVRRGGGGGDDHDSGPPAVPVGARSRREHGGVAGHPVSVARSLHMVCARP